MEAKGDSKLCQICGKSFSSPFNRNKHVRVVHLEIVQPTRTKRIICPKDQVFSFNKSLIEHLTVHHQLFIKISIHNFRDVEEFEAWRALDNRDVNYACWSRKNCANGDQIFCMLVIGVTY